MMAMLLTYICRAPYHYTSEDLVGQTNVPSWSTATKQSFWDSPVEPFSATHHNDRQITAYQDPVQHSTADPDTPSPDQPTPRSYECSQETLQDHFDVFPSSKNQSDYGCYDDGVEEITVLRTTTKKYRVRRQRDTTQRFYDEPHMNSKQSFEGDRPANSTRFSQGYQDNHAHTQQHHGPTFTPKEPGNQSIIPVQGHHISRPCAGISYEWVDDIGKDDVNYQQDHHSLVHLGSSQHTSHHSSSMEVVPYKKKRFHDEVDYHDGLEEHNYDELSDAAIQYAGRAKKMKRLAY